MANAIKLVLVISVIVIMSAVGMQEMTMTLQPQLLISAFAQLSNSSHQSISGTDSFPNGRFSESDVLRAQKIAIADSRVQQMIGGRAYVFSPSYVILGNVYNPDSGENIGLNIVVANKDVISVAVDLSSDKVVSADLVPGMANAKTGSASNVSPSSNDNLHAWLPLVSFVLALATGICIAVVVVKRRNMAYESSKRI
jgi:hypothetical protein